MNLALGATVTVLAEPVGAVGMGRVASKTVEDHIAVLMLETGETRSVPVGLIQVVLDYPVTAEDLTIAYPLSGPNGGRAVLHKTGCQHASRRCVYGDSRHIGSDLDPMMDDFFHVAPCAR